MLLNKIMVAKKGKQISVYPKMDAEEVSHDQIETKQHGLRRQRQRNEKRIEYRKNPQEEKRGKFYSRLLRKSSAIDAILYSFQNIDTERDRSVCLMTNSG